MRYLILVLFMWPVITFVDYQYLLPFAGNVKFQQWFVMRLIESQFLKFLCLLLVFFSSLPVLAWDAVGHIIVAEVAYQHLIPKVKQKVNRLFDRSHFASSFPNYAPYVYSASWPDYLDYKIKSPSDSRHDIFSYLIQSAITWHYIQDPIIVHCQQCKVSAQSPDNVVWAINYLKTKLPVDLKNKSQESAVYDLVFLTHIIGDVHQPLHNATLYDARFPEGDVGGNLYRIKFSGDMDELHALWDESLGAFSYLPRFSPYPGYRPPLSDIQHIANRVSHLCGSQNDLKPQDWERQSHQIAVNFVYPIQNNLAPQPGASVKASYVHRGQQIAAKQMCRAGKRLANVLNHIFLINKS